MSRILVIIAICIVVGTLLVSFSKDKPDMRRIRSAPTVTLVPSQSTQVMHVKLFFIALSDDGAKGQKIGCGDSLVAVTKDFPKTQTPLHDVMLALLTNKDKTYDGSGLYNALYQSELLLKSVTIDADGTAHISLSGNLNLGGVCDDPRVVAQLEETAKQFSTVKTVDITINGKSLHSLTSGKGE